MRPANKDCADPTNFFGEPLSLTLQHRQTGAVNSNLQFFNAPFFSMSHQILKSPSSFSTHYQNGNQYTNYDSYYPSVNTNIQAKCYLGYAV